MPALRNFTPFPNLRAYSTDNAGAEFGVLIVKATYAFTGDGRLVVAEEQAPMVFTDLCHGAVNETALWHPSDFVPHKPRAEILVNAVSHAPSGKPAPAWDCGLRVEGRERRLEKKLRVTGPRSWQPQWDPPLAPDEAADWRKRRERFKGWRLSEAQPALSVPLRYELAYGGMMPRGFDSEGAPIVEANQYNPIGIGWIDAEWSDHSRPAAAPQIEDSARPVSDPYETLPPQNLGPIPPVWLPRRPLGGTFDQAWIDTVWPNWPADYDFAYHNSAHPDLIWPEFFSGLERFTLSNLLPGVDHYEFRLPGSCIEAKLIRAGGAHDIERMNLDTVFLDIAADEWADRHVFLSWRLRFAPNIYSEIEFYRVAARHPARAMEAAA
jgi:hypothetical protein